jgi:hypothetical protein
MAPPPQKTYVQRDGTIVPHASRPLSARFTDLVSSFALFLTLFWHSLFQVFKVTFAAKNRLPETITRSPNHDGQMEDQDSEEVVVEDQAEQEVEVVGGLVPLMISAAVCFLYVLWLIVS